MSGILVTTRHDFSGCFHEQLFTVCKRYLTAALLEYQQVAAYFNAACLHEQAIRQT